MMKLTKAIIFIWSIILLASCEDDKPIKGGIKFEKLSFEQASVKSKNENKMLFVDAYATWCGPCKKLAKTTFVDKKVEKVFNSNFVNIKMDVDEAASLSFVEKYEINSIPTMLFFDNNGQLIKRLEGYYDEEELLQEVQQFVK